MFFDLILKKKFINSSNANNQFSGFLQNIQVNTKRYVEIFSRVIDELMPSSEMEVRNKMNILN